MRSVSVKVTIDTGSVVTPISAEVSVEAGNVVKSVSVVV
jgi:hypothetical protein